jgi:NADPH:quinone reductase-like Zn-dependent oxidoreductase
VIGETFPFDQIKNALHTMEAALHFGKLVVRVR